MKLLHHIFLAVMMSTLAILLCLVAFALLMGKVKAGGGCSTAFELVVNDCKERTK